MKAFIIAALPWVLCGIAVAIICARLGTKKENDKKTDQKLALGMALGLILGVCLNNCGLWGNHAIGLTAGPLWGMAVAILFDSKEKADADTKK